MANFSATIPADLVDAVNALLEQMDFGPNNFAAEVTEEGVSPSPFTGLHSWDNPEFRSALLALRSAYPSITITDSDGEPNFHEVCAAAAFDTSGSLTPAMFGEQRTDNGQVYESLIDYNAWSPTAYPKGWRAL